MRTNWDRMADIHQLFDYIFWVLLEIRYIGISPIYGIRIEVFRRTTFGYFGIFLKWYSDKLH